MSKSQTPNHLGERLPIAQNLTRTARLARKELTEILSDRRTILTLVLMPLLLYPLLSFAFRQFLVAFIPTEREHGYRIGVKTPGVKGRLRQHLLNGAELEVWRVSSVLGLCSAAGGPAHLTGSVGGAILAGRTGHEPLITVPRLELGTPGTKHHPPVTILIKDNLDLALINGEIDVAVALYVNDPGQLGVPVLAWEDWHVYYLEQQPSAREAAAYVEQHFLLASARRAQTILDRNDINRLAMPVRVVPKAIVADTSGPPLSLTALVPLILILMTITGAVYPAIDLTAGERERGTLEILVAAPVPRLSLLFAKYVAVLAIAILTAAVNLAMMMVTIDLTGLTQHVFKETGVTVGLLLQLLFLLALFAAFFSAVLLTLTSFARSFKEAQAYLIPLMLVSLSPGVIGMMPGLELRGIYALTPLLNIVLLARDLLEGNASLGIGFVVVGSTVVYALAAIMAASRLFGAEAVLFSEQSNWSDLLRRPVQPREAASIAGALTALALVFPTVFVVMSLLAQTGLRRAVPLQTLASLAIFAGIPVFACWWGRIRLTSALSLRFPPLVAWPAAVLLAAAAVPVIYHFFEWMRWQGLTFLTDSLVEQLGRRARSLRSVYPTAMLAAIYAITGVAEEVFFRGFLLSAFKARLGALKAIVASALLFGLFHFVSQFDSFVPSTLMGLLLGWVCWRTGSLWPAMVLHASYNAMLVYITPGESLASVQAAQEQLWWWQMFAPLFGAVGIALIWFSGVKDKAPVPFPEKQAAQTSSQAAGNDPALLESEQVG